eukprot:comp23409_c0_seq1/m.38875 comp23409_c0_seq1/g.38875  ORF comp23409_c0_seq1/g.38875 comp23409_c0_seq1/m.38875 type:complete len:315 (+) comp23409_c0_seq1:547-1491(+)
MATSRRNLRSSSSKWERALSTSTLTFFLPPLEVSIFMMFATASHTASLLPSSVHGLAVSSSSLLTSTMGTGGTQGWGSVGANMATSAGGGTSRSSTCSSFTSLLPFFFFFDPFPVPASSLAPTTGASTPRSTLSLTPTLFSSFKTCASVSFLPFFVFFSFFSFRFAGGLGGFCAKISGAVSVDEPSETCTSSFFICFFFSFFLLSFPSSAFFPFVPFFVSFSFSFLFVSSSSSVVSPSGIASVLPISFISAFPFFTFSFFSLFGLLAFKSSLLPLAPSKPFIFSGICSCGFLSSVSSCNLFMLRGSANSLSLSV